MNSTVQVYHSWDIFSNIMKKLSIYLKHFSEKFEVLRKSCSDNFCRDGLEDFTVLKPSLDPLSEPKYACLDSPCINQAFQPNGNQYCLTNYFDFDVALGYCQIYDCDSIIRYLHNGQCKCLTSTFSSL